MGLEVFRERAQDSSARAGAQTREMLDSSGPRPPREPAAQVLGVASTTEDWNPDVSSSCLNLPQEASDTLALCKRLWGQGHREDGVPATSSWLSSWLYFFFFFLH